MYLIDEPSLDLDSDMRIRVALAIRKHILRIQRAAVVVENDFLMAAYLADKVILVEPSIDTASCLPRDIARPVSGFSVSAGRVNRRQFPTFLFLLVCAHLLTDLQFPAFLFLLHATVLLGSTFCWR